MSKVLLGGILAGLIVVLLLGIAVIVLTVCVIYRSVTWWKVSLKVTNVLNINSPSICYCRRSKLNRDLKSELFSADLKQDVEGKLKQSMNVLYDM